MYGVRRAGSLLAVVAVLGLVLPGCSGLVRATHAPGAVATLRVMDYRSAVVPPPGILYSGFKAPQRISTGTLGTKRGTATVRSLGLPPLPIPGLTLGVNLVSWGDASPEEAKRNGGVSEVTHVDYDFGMILMVYRRYTTEVYGN